MYTCLALAPGINGTAARAVSDTVQHGCAALWFSLVLPALSSDMSETTFCEVCIAMLQCGLADQHVQRMYMSLLCPLDSMWHLFPDAGFGSF